MATSKQQMPQTSGDNGPAGDSNNNACQKTSWPELVGQSAKVAKGMIVAESRGALTVHIVPPDSMVTMDYRLDRVRIFEDDNHEVAQPPQVG